MAKRNEAETEEGPQQQRNPKAMLAKQPPEILPTRTGRGTSHIVQCFDSLPTKQQEPYSRMVDLRSIGPEQVLTAAIV